MTQQLASFVERAASGTVWAPSAHRGVTRSSGDAPHPGAGPLELHVLGGFSAERGGTPLGGFESDKVRALLAYLVIERGRQHRRETLASLLWPEQPAETALHRLRQALTNLRNALGDAHATTPVLLVDRAGVGLNPECRVSVDATVFADQIGVWRAHRHPSHRCCAGCAPQLGEAVALYKGAFLAGLSPRDSDSFAEWADSYGEQLRRHLVDALLALADYWERRDDYERSYEYAEHAVRLDPWREEAYIQLMRSLALSGQRSAAVRQYERCRRALRTELGVEPADETRRVREQVVAGLIGPDARPPVPPNNLPARVDAFVGRSHDLPQIHELLSTARLVTLTGPGGVGKSRLALHAAAEALPDYPDGVWFVDLAPISDASLVPSTIAQVVGAWPLGDRSPINALRGHLAGKSALLVLDNFEHVIGAAAPLGELLQACRRVRVLVTSREVLRLSGERVFCVPPLALPDSRHEPPLEQLRHYEALQLFAARARAANPAFEVTQDNAGAIAALCLRLDGLPLAIELAASLVRLLSPHEILARLSPTLPFLTEGARDLAPRQQTLRNTIAWSYNLLSPAEQCLFRSLGVFNGGWTVEAAQAVIAGGRSGNVLESIAALADKNLVRRVPQSDGEPRFALLETLREFALERLAEVDPANEWEAYDIRRSHARYFLGFAQAAQAGLRGEHQLGWFDRLDREHDNLRAALAWCIERGRAGDGAATQLGLQLAGTLGTRFWHSRQHTLEGLDWLATLLALPQAHTPTVGRARALLAQGTLSWPYPVESQGGGVFEEAAGIARDLGDTGTLALASNYLAQLDYSSERAPGRARLQEALTLFETLGDQWGIALTLLNLARSYLLRGGAWPEAADPHDTAVGTGRIFATRALAASEALGDRWLTLNAARVLGGLARLAGRLDEAEHFFQRHLECSMALGDRKEIAISFTGFGRLALDRGDVPTAWTAFEHALLVNAEVGIVNNCTPPLAWLAQIAVEAGDPRRGLRLAAIACGLFTALAARQVLVPVFRAAWKRAERARKAAQGALSREEVEAALAEIRAMTPDQAIAYARQIVANGQLIVDRRLAGDPLMEPLLAAS